MIFRIAWSVVKQRKLLPIVRDESRMQLRAVPYELYESIQLGSRRLAHGFHKKLDGAEAGLGMIEAHHLKRTP